MKSTSILLSSLVLAAHGTTWADSCLQADKKGHAGDSRYYDYGRCNQPSTAAGQLPLSAIAAQLQAMLPPESDPNDRGYSDADRAANRRAIAQYAKEFDVRRGMVKIGATVELERMENFVLSNYVFPRAEIGDVQRAAQRAEIEAAVDGHKLLDIYGPLPLEDRKSPLTWAAADSAIRWKTCEVSALVARALAYGEFIEVSQKNPARALVIARAGYQEHCGGAAYWLGRIYEDGDTLVKGVNRSDLRKDPKQVIIDAYDIAILNGYTPAYVRMAELYRLGGPARYRDDHDDWPPSPRDDAMFLAKFQYTKCLEADPANLVCAKGLAAVYSDQRKAFDYTTYDPKLAGYYGAYVQKLEALTMK